MTKKEAIAYIEQVLSNWTNWHTHHEKLVTAIEVLLTEVKNK